MIFEVMVYLCCDVLVELGCYDGWVLEIVCLFNVCYFGVDFDQWVIEMLCMWIECEGMSDCVDMVVDDIFNYIRCGVLVGLCVLYLLLFNLLGNFCELKWLFDFFVECSVVVVVLVFGDSVEVICVCQSYYCCCGVQGLELYMWDDGIVFIGSDGFYLCLYLCVCFYVLFVECGLIVVCSVLNLFVYCVMVLFEGVDQGFGLLVV